MSYTIYHADGTPVIVPDNTVDTTFYNAHPVGTPPSPTRPYEAGIGTQLVGRNAINYGAPIAQNFLQMTENFASTLAYRPADAYALQGQLWFEKTSPADGQLFLRISSAPTGGNANWRRIPITNPLTPSDGDIKVEGSGASLKIYIYGDSAWRQVFPAVYS